MEMEIVFKVGDRVTRHVAALTPRQIDRVRHGVVVLVRSDHLPNINMKTYRYSVLWDDTGEVEHGYMRGGLRPEPKKEEM